MKTLGKNILFFSLIAFFLSNTAFAKTKWGKGDLQLSDYVVDVFIEYIKGNSSKSPYMFAVSHDGETFNYYYC